jgi:DNA replication and repair protein RecF
LIIKRLKIENLRNLEQVEVDPHPELNLLIGPNGAGKTSIIESIVVLSRGRSFRTNQASELIGPGGDTFRVFAEAGDRSCKTIRMGLERSGKHWRARKDGLDLNQLSQLTRLLPLVLMEPNSHLLVSGSPEVRRKYLDWGMFHVEHRFLDTWRRFSKILKQRNAALRNRQEDVLESMNSVFSELGVKLGQYRKAHSVEISSRVQALLEKLSSNLEGVELEYREGWKRDSLLASLEAGREADLMRGTTGSGPHRADVFLSCKGIAARSVLSRGEQKILSAALILSQAEILSEQAQTPVILLDDLESEFDQNHFGNVLACTQALGGQVWISGTRQHSIDSPHKVFHVERGLVREVL